MIFSIPRVVWLLGLISFVNDTSSEMIYPLIPLYLSSVLMAGPKILGLIEGIIEALSSLLKLVSGVISDKIRATKGLVVGGYTVSSVAKPLLTLATIWPVILLLRILDKIGKGLRIAPRDALLAFSVSPGIRGKAFGLQRAMDNAGAVVGPIISTPLSSLSDRIGRKTLIISGWLIYGIFYFLLSLQTLNPNLFWILFATYGLFLAATEGAEKAFVADLADAEQLGTAYGWYNMISGILLLPASLMFGFLWEALHPEVAFGLAAFLALFSAGLLKWWLKN